MTLTNKTLLCGLLVASTIGVASAQTPRSYSATYTHTPPTIDGQINGDEWSAATEAGGWGILRRPESDVDNQNTRFRMLWDEKYLYILIQSDYANWAASAGSEPVAFVPGQQVQGISFGDDNINIYIDPNTDHEPNVRPDNQVDGYQIAWNQRDGVGSLLDDGAGGRVFRNTGLFLEAHINTPFGNQGRWQGLRKSSFVQNHGLTGGVIEFALAWADLDGPNRAQWAADPATFPTDTGTYHPKAPSSGDEWIVNISRISSDSANFLPIWSWQPAQSFAVAPHGIVRFEGGPRRYEAKFTTTAPTIDGVANPGEWDDAVPAGDWHMLRQPFTARDAEGTSFRMKWDATYLYILVKSDKQNWSPGIGDSPVAFVPGQQVQGISFGADNLNMYIDPNTDGEANDRPDNEVDGYQIAWNQFDGLASFEDDGAGGRQFRNTGLFLENHINTPFGNQGRWQGLRKSTFVQRHDFNGGVIEFALAWADLDAPRTNEWAADPQTFPADTGTAHPRPPTDGDEWIFNMSRISSDPNNFLPIWSWQPAQSFAIAPHGKIQFTGGPRKYQARYTAVAPVIDGVVTPGEWNLAYPGGGSWGVLRQPNTATDAENTRFAVQWDSSYVYFLVQSDKASWPAGPGNFPTAFVPGQQVQGISFGADNLNIYIDPNGDKESNFRPDNQVDGYQIAWNQFEGTGSLGDDGSGGRQFINTGLFLEDHINTPFGNQGNWQGLRASSFVQNHGASGGVIEFALAWSDLDAPAAAQFPNGLPDDVGTAHTQRALNGEKWIFNIARISSDANNFLPIWSWHGAQSFAVAPHGTLEFVDGPNNPRIIQSVPDPTGFRIVFTSAVGAKYDIEHSPDLVNWTVIGTDIPGTGASVTFQDPDLFRILDPTGFYRVVLK